MYIIENPWQNKHEILDFKGRAQSPSIKYECFRIGKQDNGKIGDTKNAKYWSSSTQNMKYHIGIDKLLVLIFWLWLRRDIFIFEDIHTQSKGLLINYVIKPEKSLEPSSNRNFKALQCPQNSVIRDKGWTKIYQMLVWHDWILKSWVPIFNQ